MYTINKKLLSVTIVSCFLFILGLVITTVNQTFSFFYFFFYFIFALFLLKNRFISIKERQIFVFSYSFLFLMAAILIYHHQFYYDMPFDAYGDDSRFFYWGKEFQENLFLPSYSFFEKFIALIFLFFSFFKLEPNIYQVLPLNILAASYVVVLSHRIVFKITGLDLSLKLIFVLILLNYSFTDNVVHLYRDVYVALFSMLFILAVYERRNLKALFMVALTALVRLPNGIFLLAILPIHEFFLEKKSNIIKSWFLGLILILLFSISILFGVKFSKYDLSQPEQIVFSRVTKFSASARDVGGGLAIVNDMPFPLRFFINTYVQVVRPVSINGIFYPVRESLSHLKIINHKSIGWGVTTITLFFLVGRYVSGITKLLLFRDKKFLIALLYFLMLTTVVGFLSYLDRHRVFLIPIFPLIYSLSFLPNKNTFQRLISSSPFNWFLGFLMFFATMGVSLL